MHDQIRNNIWKYEWLCVSLATIKYAEFQVIVMCIVMQACIYTEILVLQLHTPT